MKGAQFIPSAFRDQFNTAVRQIPDRAGDVKPDVLSYYLNTPFFIGRSLIAIAGWSVLAFLLPRTTGRPGQFVAAVGLVFHCVVISVVAVDWVLTLEPPFISSSFGAPAQQTSRNSPQSAALHPLRVGTKHGAVAFSAETSRGPFLV